MKQIKISQIKIGDKLIDTLPTEFGYFTNRTISNIKITKTGRIKIEFSYDYIKTNGDRVYNKILNYSNGALHPDTLIYIQ